MTAIDVAAALVGGLLALSLAVIVLGGRRGVSNAVYALSAALSLGLALIGVTVLAASAGATTLSVPIGLPWLGANLRLDALSALFLLVLGTGGGAASVYAIGYGRHEHEPQRVLPFYPGFLAAMSLVVLADDAFTFLLSWEMMSLLSWALVLTHHHADETRRAGYIYLLMAGFGTMVLLLAFGLLAGADGSYHFAALRETDHSQTITTIVIVLMLLGTGSKAGLYPLHVWLPLAHPAAPSHVSALMSGVMTKVAVYGFVRVTFDILGPQPVWLAMAVMATGGITAVMGVLLALMQHDLKRLLAYHTVENIGIIFIGLGLAMAFRADGQTAGAALALTAALFHVFNHMLFKSLLFMGAGSVLNATGMRDMEKMGGLIHRMPVSAVAFLVGCVAISALPPFNGFVSEWLTFQAILISPDLTSLGARMIAPAVGGLLALAAALAATCFVKVYGVVFLGRARSDAAGNAAEVDRFSVGAMLTLALLCLLAGVLPGIVIDLLRPVVDLLAGSTMPLQGNNAWLTITPIEASRSSYSGFLVLVFIATSGGVVAWLVHNLASRELRRGPAWDCGFPNADPVTQYTAGSFAQPIRRIMGPVLAARETVTMPAPGDMSPARHVASTLDLAWARLYLPLAAAVGIITRRLNGLQFLTIRRYLSLVFASLILLLVGLAIWN